MNPFQLFHEDGKPTGIFACGKCRIVHRDQFLALQCCEDRKCPSCGALEKYGGFCAPCRDIEDAKREAARFEKAEKIPEADYAGAVYFDDDKFFRDTEELREHCADCDRELPKYVWACHERPVCTLDYERITEDATQDAYEDFTSDDLDGKAELVAALDAFNERNKGVVVWEPDLKRAVILEPCTTQPTTS